MQIDFSSLFFLSIHIYIYSTYLGFTHSCTKSKICLQLFFNLQSPTESHSSISNPFFDFVQGWGIKPKRPIALFLPRLTRLRIPTGPHNNRNLFFFANFLILTLHTQVHNLFFSLSIQGLYWTTNVYTIL